MKLVTHEKTCRVCNGVGTVTMKNGGYDVETDCDLCLGYGTVCFDHGDPQCVECFV